jgi:hypothetical protein
VFTTRCRVLIVLALGIAHIYIYSAQSVATINLVRCTRVTADPLFEGWQLFT